MLYTNLGKYEYLYMRQIIYQCAGIAFWFLITNFCAFPLQLRKFTNEEGQIDIEHRFLAEPCSYCSSAGTKMNPYICQLLFLPTKHYISTQTHYLHILECVSYSMIPGSRYWITSHWLPPPELWLVPGCWPGYKRYRATVAAHSRLLTSGSDTPPPRTIPLLCTNL